MAIKVQQGISVFAKWRLSCILTQKTVEPVLKSVKEQKANKISLKIGWPKIGLKLMKFQV